MAFASCAGAASVRDDDADAAVAEPRQADPVVPTLDSAAPPTDLPPGEGPARLAVDASGPDAATQQRDSGAVDLTRPPDVTVANAQGCGPPRAEWPGALNTGVPPGTVLRPSGSITVSRNGAVIEDLDIAGCLRIAASDVTVRRTRIRRTGDCGSVTMAGDRGAKAYTGIVFQDVEIDAAGGAPTFSAAVVCWNCTLCRIKLHDVMEGVRLDSNTTVQDSYIYAIGSIGLNANSASPAGQSNLVVRHNTVEDPPGADNNVKSYHALVQVSSDHGSPDGVLIENNLLVGGPWAVSVGGASNVRVVGNRVSRKYYPQGGRYGALRLSGAVASGNVWHETGEPL